MKLSEVSGGSAIPAPKMKLSDVSKDDPMADYNPWAATQGDPNLSLGDVGDIATGAVAGIPGTAGDIESFGRSVINKVGGDVSEDTFLPTTEDIEGSIAGEPTDERASAYRSLGSVLSPGLFTEAGAAVKGAKALTATGRAAKLGEAVKSGELGKEVLSAPRAAATARKEAADTAYAQADTAMAAKQAQEPWQEHPSGRAFLDDLDSKISTAGTTQETAATRAELRRIKDDLQGAPDPNGGTAYSTPSVIRETLRKLRDRASGAPETGFDAIEQQRAGDLADDLAKSVADWEPSLKAADDQYREMSKALYPKGVVPGKFAKEIGQAEKSINLLEKQMSDGTVPTKEAVSAVRDLLKTKSVSRLMDSKTAQDLNARLDKIDRAAKRGKAYRKAGGYVAGALGVGALGRSLGIWGGH